MRTAVLGLLLVGCAHERLRVVERDATPEARETAFVELEPPQLEPPSLEGAVASIGNVVPYGLREMTLAMDIAPGCQRNRDCFARALTLTGTLTGVAGTFSGAITALTLTTTQVAGSVAVQLVQSSKLCLNGTSACLEYGGLTHDVQVSGTGGFISPGTLHAQGDIRVSDQILNPGTGAACSSNGGAVCVDDAGGFAVANGSGTTGFHASGTGEITSASTKTRGTITLAAGTGTATVNASAFCVCTDTTAAAVVQCAVSGTTLTATGTGTDVIAYHCLY